MSLWTDAGCHVSAALLTGSLMDSAPLAVRNADGAVATRLGLRLKRIFGAGSVRKSRKADGIYYTFIGISKLRSDFDRYTGIGIDWGDTVDTAAVIERNHVESSPQHSWH